MKLGCALVDSNEDIIFYVDNICLTCLQVKKGFTMLKDFGIGDGSEYLDIKKENYIAWIVSAFKRYKWKVITDTDTDTDAE